MRYHEILEEDADYDLNVVGRARKVFQAFQAFIQSHQGTALKDVPGCEFFPRNGGGSYVFDVHKVCPDVVYRNLMIGVEFFTDRAPDRRACFTVARVGHVPVGVVLSNLGVGDPGDDTNVAYMFDHEEVIHELIHYFDWRRFKRQEEWSNENERVAISKTNRAASPDEKSEKHRTQLDQKRYFNSTKEMNAYFQQGTEQVLADMVRAATEREKLLVDDPEWADSYRVSYLGSYADFTERYMHRYYYKWRYSLTPTNKKVFLKRFYGLYVAAKTKWPNIPSIQQEVGAF